MKNTITLIALLLVLPSCVGVRGPSQAERAAISQEIRDAKKAREASAINATRRPLTEATKLSILQGMGPGVQVRFEETDSYVKRGFRQTRILANGLNAFGGLTGMQPYIVFLTEDGRFRDFMTARVWVR